MCVCVCTGTEIIYLVMWSDSQNYGHVLSFPQFALFTAQGLCSLPNAGNISIGAVDFWPSAVPGCSVEGRKHSGKRSSSAKANTARKEKKKKKCVTVNSKEPLMVMTEARDALRQKHPLFSACSLLEVLKTWKILNGSVQYIECRLTHCLRFCTRAEGCEFKSQGLGVWALKEKQINK